MTGRISTGIGRAVSGQKDLLFIPPGWKGDGTKPLVTFFHGSTGDGWTPLNANAVSQYRKCKMIADRYGLPVMTSDQDGAPATPGKSEANDASQANTLTAITWARTLLGTKTGNQQVIGVGESMGSGLLMILMANNPLLFRAAALQIPGVNHSAEYNADAAYAADVDQAYSNVAGGWATAAATHDPWLVTGQLTGQPIAIFDTTDDPISGGTDGIAAFVARVGGSAIESHFYGTGGHDASVIPADPVAAYVAVHAA